MERVKHKPYHMVPAYARLAGMTIDDLAQHLGISRQLMSRKIYGPNDFKLSEVKKLTEILNRTAEDLFLTE